jgi:prepilin-type N-terminal cleavage/methylation domain-containing protein
VRPLLRGREDGFTLLELMVCLGLLALISAFLAQGLSLVRHGGGMMERAERDDSLRAVQMYLARALEGALPAFQADESGAASAVFDGSGDSLRFIGRSDGRLEGGGLVVVEFRIDALDGERRLIVGRRAVRAEDDGAREPEAHLLLAGVAAAKFRYFGRPDDRSEPGWAAEWRARDALPQLVEITVIPAEKGLFVWTPLTIAIPAGSASGN